MRGFFTQLFSNILNVIIGVAVIGFIIWGMVQYIYTRPGPLEAPTIVEIEQGSGLIRAAEVLRDKGVIDNALFFRIAASYAKEGQTIKFGEYEIPEQASIKQVFEILVEGKGILQQFAVPEGLTSWEIVQRLNAAPELVGEIVDIPAEGALAPNTYSYQKGTDRQVIIDQMLESQEQILAQAWENRNPDVPLESAEELLILASIVEKETGIGGERPMVASVFVNRLNDGMRLQTDPTVIYGVTGGREPLGRGLRRSELDGETPYNTYIIQGLPPTPIANPGRAAIEAAANPAETDFYYFVADGTGGHAFSRTLDEHNANVREWRRIEAERAAAAEAES